MDESTKATVEKYQARLALLDAQANKIKTAINGLYELEGEEPPYANLDGSENGSANRPQTIRPDQFFGRPLATAVKEILSARSQRNQGAIPMDELFALMISGGFDFEGKDETAKKRTLAITIGKNPAFVRVPSSGHVGLAEWYPNVKRKSPTNNGDEPDENEEKSNAQNVPPGTPTEFTAKGGPEEIQ